MKENDGPVGTEGAHPMVWTLFGLTSETENNTIIRRLFKVTFVADMVIKVAFYHLKRKHVDKNKTFSTPHFGSKERSFHSGLKRDSTMKTSLHESLTSHCPVPC